MLTHVDLLKAVAEERKPTFISTGMSTYEEIDAAVKLFRSHDCPFVLMHCISEYPAQEKSLNLRCLQELRQRYNCPVGYSGHEVTMVPGVIAVAMGAVAIERHITLDRAMYGSDQAASLERRGLESMVGYIRTIPMVLGDGIKRVTSSEQANAEKLRYFLGPYHDIEGIVRQEMTYCFDIDGVLCNNTHGRYELAEPYQQVIARVNALYEQGHRVILFTARGTTTGIDWRELTEQQMRAWGVKYHQLFFGKPEADIYVDDRAMGPVTWGKSACRPVRWMIRAARSRCFTNRGISK